MRVQDCCRFNLMTVARCNIAMSVMRYGVDSVARGLRGATIAITSMKNSPPSVFQTSRFRQACLWTKIRSMIFSRTIRHSLSDAGSEIKISFPVLCLCLVLVACEAKVQGRWYTPSQVTLGSEVYARHCIACHNADAQGISNWKDRNADGSYPPPPLNGSAHAWHHPLSILSKTIQEGGIRLGGKMPPFGDKLSEDETLAVISYFQNFWSEDIYQGWLKRGGTE